MSQLVGKVLVAQGGGPTAVINQSFVGAVLEARKFPQVTRVYGALHGVNGVINENFIDLTEATIAVGKTRASPPRPAAIRFTFFRAQARRNLPRASAFAGTWINRSVGGSSDICPHGRKTPGSA